MDLEKLFRLRLVVARFGEGDRLRWWHTSGVLTTTGASVYTRGFPRSQAAARARVIFAAAAARCDELLPEPAAFHLFRLPPELEGQADEFLVSGNGTFAAAVDAVAGLAGDMPLDAALASTAGLAPDQFAAIKSVKLSGAARAFVVPAAHDATAAISLLAAGFIRSSSGTLLVPYTSSLA